MKQDFLYSFLVEILNEHFEHVTDIAACEILAKKLLDDEMYRLTLIDNLKNNYMEYMYYLLTDYYTVSNSFQTLIHNITGKANQIYEDLL